jgi:large subunit ribosomal protein L25
MAKALDNHLVSELRTRFGKGAARKIRAEHKIPAVLYGHGTEPQHITLPGHETMLLIRKANQVLELDIAGQRQLALVKDVQKDPVRQVIEHIDLLIVRAGEKVTVEVPVHVEGQSASGTVVSLDTKALSLEVEATHIPENIVVNVDGLEEGAHVVASALTLPEGATLVSDPDAVVVAVSVPAAAPEPVETPDEDEAPAAEDAPAADAE